MGNFYQNVTLKGPTTERVVATLKELGRSAYVTPAVGDVTVVFDAGLDEMSRVEDVADVPATLSVHLQCPALLAGVYDDDVLYLALYEGLRNTFEYVSSDRKVANVRHLCAVFGVRGASLKVWFLLKLPHPVPYLFESFRHLHVLRALRLPDYAYATGYRSIQRAGEPPPGLDLQSLVRV